MSSEAQKKRGHPIPEEWITEETASYCITIPAGEDFRRAAYAQLLELGKWWQWKRDEDPNSTRSKETAETWRLLFELNEDCGGFLMTPEEFYDANKRSIYDAWNDIAKQIVSGRVTDILVGADGTVTDPTAGGGDAGLPEDDPTTAYDDTKAARYGGAYNLIRGIEIFFDKLDGYYGAVNGTPVTTAAQTKTIIKAYFPNDGALMDTAIDIYYTYRTTNNQFVFNANAAMAAYLYCNGANERGFLRWLIDVSTFPQLKVNTMTDLVIALSEEFWTDYYTEGTDTPSTAYLDADCEPIQDQTLGPLVFGTNYFTTVLKLKHRMAYTSSGYALDVDGDIQDTWWYRSAAGVLSFTPWNFVLGAGNQIPTSTQVPYRSDHVYNWTYDVQAANFLQISPSKAASMNAAGLTYPVPFSMTLKDLGQVL